MEDKKSNPLEQGRGHASAEEVDYKKDDLVRRTLLGHDCTRSLSQRAADAPPFSLRKDDAVCWIIQFGGPARPGAADPPAGNLALREASHLVW